jgi:uncharacterized protein DUF4926
MDNDMLLISNLLDRQSGQRFVQPESFVPERLHLVWSHAIFFERRRMYQVVQFRRPKLLNLVEVLKYPPDVDVEVGDVGIVVELLPPDGIEVECLDRGGRTRCLATLSVKDVLTFNRERTLSVKDNGTILSPICV